MNCPIRLKKFYDPLKQTSDNKGKLSENDYHQIGNNVL